jgi:hypothetical protein
MKLCRILPQMILSCSLTAAAQTITSPNVQSGDTAILRPLQRECRLQQIYSASDFAGITTVAYITQIALRYEGQPFPNDSATASNVMVTLSTTPKAVDSLSPLFTENIGSDATVVFGTAPVLMPGWPGSGAVITFTRPFLYDPSSGNLLVDFQNFGGISPAANIPFFDAHSAQGDSVSILASNDPEALNGLPSSVGLVTQFTFSPIPEPNTALLLAFAALAAFAHSRLRARGKGNTHAATRRTIA